jgi:hypothetical protein
MPIEEAHKFSQIAEEVTAKDLRRVPQDVHQHAVSGHFPRSMEQARQMDAFWHMSFWLQEHGYSPYLDFI